MIRSKLAWLSVLVLLFSCSSVSYWKMRIEVPTKALVDLKNYEKIFIGDFLIQEDREDFDLNRETIDYFTFEIGQQFKGKVSPHKITLEEEETFDDKEFWKQLSSEKESIFLTGSLKYTQEIRKAILRTQKRRLDEPFAPEKAVEERRFFTLNLKLYLIETNTGEILYTRDFNESRGYTNPNQTAFFAFFDLIQRVRDKLFRTILGGPQIQERYLISY